MRDPAARQAVVDRLREVHQSRKAEAGRQADLRGLPKRMVLPDAGVAELMDWVDGRPLYYATANANAAISTGANLVRAVPYSVDGAGWTVGVWDGGGVRTNHQEFGGRVTIRDGCYTNIQLHATHVTGTIAATGVVATAMGMARAVKVDSYDWDDDAGESALRGASYGGEPGKIYLSNHSYTYLSGWQTTGTSAWTWYGSGTTQAGYEAAFGQYNDAASEIDGRLHGLPYYLTVWAAANERDDNPAYGATVALVPGGATVAYDSALHPAGDGAARGGYDTIAFYAGAKNVLTVGSVRDAVVSGQRNLSGATMEAYSSWGPTDDGRIKPDLVANGYLLDSTSSGGTASYGTMSGTSMAAPNATGTAQLLLSLYTTMKPGEYMRASTLKALLVHTADDLGTAGPDYQFGWGLINAKAAADLICTAATNPAVPTIIESAVTPSAPVQEHLLNWDGLSPIRATLGWTDPAGTATTLHDSRTAKLVNNLNLRLVAPDGAAHLPFVMPFVGTWTTASMSAAATTGTNNVDNVEQVLVAAPAKPGIWKAVVSYSGTLSGSLQNYALVISGSQKLPPNPLRAVPDYAASPADVVVIQGANFDASAAVAFFRADQPDAPADVQSASSTNLVCAPDYARMAQGWWNVRVTNEDAQFGEATNALAIATALTRANFEVAPAGWTASPSVGSSYWSIIATNSHTPTRAYFAPGPATKNTDNLSSPVYAIPAEATGIRFRFWHRYAIEVNDGCVLEVSADGGSTWKQIGESGSGASFVRGGYTTVIATPPGKKGAELAGQSAWTGNGGDAFAEVAVALDPAVYAGAALRVRWRLSTDATGASAGWWVDTFGVHAFTPARGTAVLLR